MQDSIFHMTLKSHLISDFLHQNVKISPFENTMFYECQRIMDLGYLHI